MIPLAVRTAQRAVSRYKTRDPFELAEAKKIKIWPFEQPESLLGLYVVLNRTQYIGINRQADEVQTRTCLLHELGHSLNDYRAAASGHGFSDNFYFFSLSAEPMEEAANMTAAEVCISDDYILDQICYAQYQHTLDYINQHIGSYALPRAQVQFREEQMQEFYDCHPEMPTCGMLAGDLGIAEELVRYKLRILNYKGFDLPNIPETRSDFLRDWKNAP
ncbi:MAG: ImmA/IrrE family metallo-endopeptidase [Clostridia bacterium]|nr:ImmA/IrrE family metallo-endopeptidase [Clostridia bacterium]